MRNLKLRKRTECYISRIDCGFLRICENLKNADKHRIRAIPMQEYIKDGKL